MLQSKIGFIVDGPLWMIQTIEFPGNSLKLLQSLKVVNEGSWDACAICSSGLEEIWNPFLFFKKKMNR